MSAEVPTRVSSPSLAVIEAVAAREGVDPLALDPAPFDVVDPDALDRLVRSVADGPADSPFRVAFRFHGYEVVVSVDGSVDLHRTANARSR